MADQNGLAAQNAPLILGGSGADYLTGTAGSTVNGGAGNDVLDADGTGPVTYVFGEGAGHDVWVASPFAATGDTLADRASDTILLDGLDPSDVELVWDYGSWSDYGSYESYDWSYASGQAFLRIKSTGDTLALGKLTYTYNTNPTANDYGEALIFDSDAGTYEGTLSSYSGDYGAGPTGLLSYGWGGSTSFRVLQFADGTKRSLTELFDFKTLASTTADPSWTSAYSEYLAAQPADGVIRSNANSITGTSGADTVLAGYGANSIQMQGGDDSVSAGRGNDAVYGGDGSDTLRGDQGDDYLVGGTGNNLLDGGSGNDAANYSDRLANEGIIANLSTSAVTVGPFTVDAGHVRSANGDVDTLVSIELIYGGAGADVIIGSEANNTLTGGAGNDTIDGGAGDDEIQDYADSNSLLGGAGNDVIYADGNSTVRGGDGNDTISTGSGIADGGEGSDMVLYYASYLSTGAVINLTNAAVMVAGVAYAANTATDSVGNTVSLVSIEAVQASFGDDTVFGGNGAESVDGYYGNDIITGGRGNDSLDGNSGNNTVDGGRDNDLITGGDNNDLLLGGDGNDVIRSNYGFRDVMSGGKGDDVVALGGGKGLLLGGDGNDQLSAGYLGMLIGGAGNDTLIGGTGENWLDGGDGDDLINGGAGSGVDIASYDSATNGVTVSLAITTAQVTGSGTDTLLNIRGLVGSRFNDSLTGDNASNVLVGGDGNDTISGGGFGNDNIIGGKGADDLTGGDHVQRLSQFSSIIYSKEYRYYSLDEVGDTIHGFTQDDRIVISAAGFGTTLPTGPLLGTYFHSTQIPSSQHKPNKEFFYDGVHKQLIWDPDGTGSAPGIVIATFDTVIDFRPSQIVIRDDITPIDIMLSDFGIAADAKAGATVGDLSAVNYYDPGTPMTYSLVGNTGNMFALDGNHLLLAQAVHDAAGSVLSVTVRGTGVSGKYYDQAFSIVVQEAVVVGPTAMALSHAEVEENTRVGEVIGTFSSENVDPGSALTYTLLDTSDGMFSISGNQLIVRANLDYEVAATRDISVRVTDATGHSLDQVFTIYITNVAGVVITGTDDADLVSGPRTFAGQITPTLEEDVISGGGGNDAIYSSWGNDYLDGGTGADSMVGGTGDDVYIIDNAADVAVELPAQGIDEVRSSVNWTLGANFENLVLDGAATNGTGNTLANSILGNINNNLLIGGRGADTLNGSLGFDTASYVTSGTGVWVSLATGTGSGGDATGDVLISIEALIGSNYDDTLIGDAGDNTLTGGMGGDLLIGGAGRDTASYATASGGVVASLSAPSTNRGQAMRDAYDSIENLTGSDFADTLTGDIHANRLNGGGGDDVLIGGGYADTLDGGAGVNTASYVGSQMAIFASMVDPDSNTGDAAQNVYINIQNLTGSSYADTLTGDAGGNVLNGGLGNDLLIGGGGNDTLVGGSGNDVLVGGAGADVLSGSSGADLFRFDAATESGLGVNADVIQDFSRAAGDKIGLAAIDANAEVAGDQAFAFLGTAAFVAGQAGQLRYELRGDGNTWVMADLNGDAQADFEIQLTGTIALVASDFIL